MVAGTVLLAGCLAACNGTPTAAPHDRPRLPTPSAAGPPVPAFAADMVAGRAHFHAHCLACHGEGDGKGPLARGLQPPPPDWTAVGALRDRSPLDLYRAIRRGVLGSSMKRFDHVLDETATWDTVFHIWRLSPSTSLQGSGAERYAEACAACHGLDGLPDDPSAAPAVVRPEWVRFSRRALVDRIAQSHPEIAAASASGPDGASNADAIAEHLWSYLAVPADRAALPTGAP